MPKHRSAHSTQQAQIKPIQTQSKQVSQQNSRPIIMTLPSMDNRYKLETIKDHLNWGHDNNTDTSSVSDGDEEIILFENTRNRTNTIMYPQIHSGHNSEIGINPSSFNTIRTSENDPTRSNKRKKVRNRTNKSDTITTDSNFICYHNLCASMTAPYPSLDQNVQFLLRAMNIDIHLGSVFFFHLQNQIYGT